MFIKTKSRPKIYKSTLLILVKFLLTKAFNETVAMNLKDIEGHRILHVVDHATRYSTAPCNKIQCSCKDPELGQNHNFYAIYFNHLLTPNIQLSKRAKLINLEKLLIN